MNYSQFKTFLGTFLWKQNDTDLANNLDSLIRMADGELNRVLDIQRRQRTLVIEPESQDYTLPADFRHMVSLSNLDESAVSAFSSTTLIDLYRKRRASNGNHLLPYYAVDQGDGADKILRLVGPFSPTNPGSLVLIYRANVPDFQALDSSWLEADFLDLYTYTVFSHAAPFLREDERLPVWMEKQATAIASALEEDRHQVVHGGTPLRMQPHRKVP